MLSLPYYTADVFTSRRFGGNQLAVFPDASAIPAEDMPRIAREFNFSETTFVLPPRDPRHTRWVRIFTPGGELPFAGHPTVGTAFVLATAGLVPLAGDETRLVFEEGVGPVPVLVRAENGVPGFAQLSVAQLPEFGPPAPGADDLARVLSLAPGEVLDGPVGPEAVSCGVPFLFIPVPNRAVLARAQVRLEEFNALLRGYWTRKVFVFCNDPELPGSHYRGRMFAPEIGVPEDPATGSACACFGGYLAKRQLQPDAALRWVVEQGFEMGRPSLLEVEADKSGGRITAVRVGGRSVLVSRGEFYL
jgi:trans-2,3-dihydro-3-hydroxyanthranilate isomerase